MMFFPVVLCGFYLILTESEKGNWRRYAVLTALGLTGLVQSHVLSCEMAAFIILPVCLFALSRHTIKPLVLAGLLSVLLNLGFLVPFLDYYNTDLYIVSGQWTGSNADRFQELGVFPLQLFSLFGHGTGTTLVTASGAAYECTVSVGIFPLLGLFLFCYLLLCHLKECRSRREFIPACVCTAFGCLFLYMSTCYFPWDAIASRNGWAKIVVDSLQFPWRLLAPSIALLTFTCCFSVKSFFACYGKTAAMPVLLSALTLLAVNCGWYFYDYMFSQDPYRVYDTNDLNSMTLYSCEYLPTGTDLENFESNLVAPSESISYTDYVKNGTSLSCHVTASGEAGFIDFPLTRYKYYTCVDTQTKIPLEISSGYNNRIRVTFPAGFDSDISIYFKEPVHWRIAEAVSLLTAAALCCCLSLASLRRRSKRPAQEA